MPKPLEVPAKGRAAATFALDDGLWTLYELPAREYEGSSPLWLPFKLMLPPKTPMRWRMRRSYRLMWNALDQRFRREEESRRLETERPELAQQVELYMSLSYDRQWLVTVNGMTEPEIEAEKRRLAEMRRRTV